MYRMVLLIAIFLADLSAPLAQTTAPTTTAAPLAPTPYNDFDGRYVYYPLCVSGARVQVAIRDGEPYNVTQIAPCLDTIPGLEIVNVYVVNKCNLTESLPGISDLPGNDTICVMVFTRNDERKEFVLSFPGAFNNYQRLEAEYFYLLDTYEFFGLGGVNSAYANAQNLLFTSTTFLQQYVQQINAYPTYSVTLTGYSYGAAIALLGGVELHVSNRLPSKNRHVKIVTMGEPKVGTLEFAGNVTNLLNFTTSRIVHRADEVPHSPFDIIDATPLPIYQQFGQHPNEVWYNNSMYIGSTFMICDRDNFTLCSDTLNHSLYNRPDHLHYFGLDVSTFEFNNSCTYINLTTPTSQLQPTSGLEECNLIGWQPSLSIPGKYYNIIEEPSEWTAMNQTCIAMSTVNCRTSLVSINSAFESTEIRLITDEQKEICAELWIGYVQIDGVWQWSDGNNQTYANWKSGYPHLNAGFDYAAFDAQNGYWINYAAGVPQCGICELMKK